MNLQEQIYRIQEMMRLNEQDTRFTIYLNKKQSNPNFNREFINAHKEMFDKFPEIYMLATGLGTAHAAQLWNQGKHVESIIEAATSPLSMLRTLRVLKALGVSTFTVKTLETINKTGLPLLISQGKEKFLNWGFKTYGDDFGKFMVALKKEIPKDLKNHFEKK